MRIECDPHGKRDVFFRYRNLGFTRVHLFVARPSDCCVQRDVAITNESQEPCEILSLAGNDVGHYDIAPGKSLAIEWTFERLEPRLVPGPSSPDLVMSESDRCWNLRRSIQVDVNEAIALAARQIAGDQDDSIAVAKSFFRELVSNYQYEYPVRDRVASEMLRVKRGDCGQFSNLFVALCRSKGIPARAVVGTFVNEARMRPHVWAEFWIDGIGWIPVDPSIGQAIARGGLSGQTDPEVVFGHLAPSRFAFSHDVDLPIGAAYPSLAAPPLITRVWGPRFGAKKLAWGYESLEGDIPYLQPAYPGIVGPRIFSELISRPAVGEWTAGNRRGVGFAIQGIAPQVAPLVLALVVVVAVANLLMPSLATHLMLLGAVFISAVLAVFTFVFEPMSRYAPTSLAFNRRVRH